VSTKTIGIGVEIVSDATTTFKATIVPVPENVNDIPPEWWDDHIYPLTGAGDLSYDCRIVASEDARLIGKSYGFTD
jgi:hypothetical protein